MRFLDSLISLQSSNASYDQWDEHGRLGAHIVFSSVVSDARRKRRKVYFASLHEVDVEPQGLANDTSGVSAAELVLPDYVLVV